MFYGKSPDFYHGLLEQGTAPVVSTFENLSRIGPPERRALPSDEHATERGSLPAQILMQGEVVWTHQHIDTFQKASGYFLGIGQTPALDKA